MLRLGVPCVVSSRSYQISYRFRMFLFYFLGILVWCVHSDICSYKGSCSSKLCPSFFPFPVSLSLPPYLLSSLPSSFPSFIDVCTCVCVCVFCVWMGAHIQQPQEDAGVLLQNLMLYSFHLSFLSKSAACYFHLADQQPQQSPCLGTHSGRITGAHPSMPSYYVGVENSNSCFHAGTGAFLPNEPSPRALKNYFLRKALRPVW